MYLAVVTVSVAQNFLGVTEGDDDVPFCIEISDIPPLGVLEVDVIVTINVRGIDDITGRIISVANALNE